MDMLVPFCRKVPTVCQDETNQTEKWFQYVIVPANLENGNAGTNALVLLLDAAAAAAA